MALHALTLLIARRLVADIELYRGRIDLHVVPPLCPVKSTLVDFARSAQLIELALQSTRAWLRGGGLDRTEVPGSLRPHAHPAVDSLI
jgi:NTE family protein